MGDRKPIVSPITRGQGHELLNKLEAAGLDQSLAQRVIDSPDNDLANRWLRYLEAGCPNRVTQLGNVDAQLARWAANFQRKGFGFKLDTSKLEIPDYRDGFGRLIVVPDHKVITTRGVFEVCGQHFRTQGWTDESLDEVIDEDKEARDPHRNGTYAIWVRDRIEADKEHKSKSADNIQKANISSITLLEHQLLELDYFFQTGQHLDIKNITLCAGSRCADGDVPRAYWYDDRFCVGGCLSSYAGGFLRVREVVTNIKR